jgi:hypothetical protein
VLLHRFFVGLSAVSRQRFFQLFCGRKAIVGVDLDTLPYNKAEVAAA